MVPLPGVKEEDSTGAILTGCSRVLEDQEFEASGSIYKLTWSPKGDHLIWKRLPQNLHFPRTFAIAMIIPDSMTSCRSKFSP